MDLRGDTFRGVAAPHASVAAAAFACKKLHAVAGIGNPKRFFEHLAQMGLASVNHAFPDHHAYSASDLDFDDCEALLMTEKDAVKCEAFAREHWYALQVEAELAPAFFDFILAKLNGLKTA
jgi:tetraacyldisaccharide 4'-kinase